MTVSHFSVGLEPNEDGWYPARCECGWGDAYAPYPSAEDACDALMEHAYAAGVWAEREAAEGRDDYP